MQFMGDDLFLEEATEPTNIIWENRHFTAQEYFVRTCKVFVIVFFMISVSFVLIFVCKVKAIEVSNMYPTVDCTDILKTYGNYTSQQQYAYREYVAYYHPPYGSAQPFSGILQCHCEDTKDNNGTALLEYEVTDKTGANPYRICNKYVWDQWMSLVYSNSVSYMIVGINYVLRLFIIKLIIYIGKDTESEQTRLITNGVFIVQFFNTGLLLLAVNANLEEQGRVTGFIFNRDASDFDSSWF